MKNLMFLIPVICGSVMVGCSTATKMVDAESRQDVVLSRIDNLSERPSWLHESEAFKIVGGDVVSMGSTTIPGDDRVDGAYRIAENNAKAGIVQGIESKLEFIFQNAEEGTAIGSEQTRFIGSEVASMTTSSIRPKLRYWEKVAVHTDSGQIVTRYRVFAEVSMPEADFKRAVIDALKKHEGSSGISKEFAQKVESNWDRLVESIPKEQAAQ